MRLPCILKWHAVKIRIRVLSRTVTEFTASNRHIKMHLSHHLLYICLGLSLLPCSLSEDQYSHTSKFAPVRRADSYPTPTRVRKVHFAPTPTRITRSKPRSSKEMAAAAKQAVEAVIANNRVAVFSKTYCPFCKE